MNGGLPPASDLELTLSSIASSTNNEEDVDVHEGSGGYEEVRLHAAAHTALQHRSPEARKRAADLVKKTIRALKQISTEKAEEVADEQEKVDLDGFETASDRMSLIMDDVDAGKNRSRSVQDHPQPHNVTLSNCQWVSDLLGGKLIS